VREEGVEVLPFASKTLPNREDVEENEF